MWKNEHHTEHNQKSKYKLQHKQMPDPNQRCVQWHFRFLSLFLTHSVSLSPFRSLYAHFHLHVRLHRSAYSEIVEYLFHGIYYLAVYITCSRSCARAPCCMMLFFSLLLPVHSVARSSVILNLVNSDINGAHKNHTAIDKGKCVCVCELELNQLSIDSI